jgi:nicotinamidase-related amidase
MGDSIVGRPFYMPTLDLEKDLRRVGFHDSKRDFELGPGVAVLVIDMSAIFVEEMLYPRADKGVGRACVEAHQPLLEQARASDVPIIFTTGYRFGTEAEHGSWIFRFNDEQKRNFTLFDDESLHDIDPDIAPRDGDIVVLKAKPSAFFGTQLESILNFHRIDTLVITGMSTSGCVRATVVDAFSLNYKVVVPIECVADSRRASHEITLYDIDAQMGDVRPVEEVITELKQLGS